MSEIVQDEEASSLLAPATSLSTPAAQVGERVEQPCNQFPLINSPHSTPMLKSLFPILTEPRLVATPPSSLTFPGIAKEITHSFNKYLLCYAPTMYQLLY